MRNLRQLAPSDPRYIEARHRALSGYGLFPSDAPFSLANVLAEPPVVRPEISSGKATVVVSASVAPVECCLAPATWTVERQGDLLRFGTSAARVPYDVRWVIDVRTQEGRLEGVRPLPTAGDAHHHVRWMFESTDDPVDAAFRLRLEPRERWILQTQDLPTAYVQPTLWKLGPLALLLGLFGGLLYAIQRGVVPRRAPIVRWLALLFGCFMVLVVIAASQILNYARYVEYPYLSAPLGSFEFRHFMAALPTAIAAAAPAVAFAVGITLLLLRTLPRTPLVAVMTATAATTVGAHLVLALRDMAWENGVSFDGFPWNLSASAAAGISAASVALSAMLAIIFLALAVLAAFPSRSRPRPRRLWWIAAAALAAVITFQWAAWVDRLGERSTLQAAAGFGPWKAETFAEAAQRDALNYPSGLGWQVAAVVPIVGLAVAGSWLWFVQATRPGSQFVPRRRGVIPLLAAIFGVFCGTTADIVLGIPVPFRTALLIVLLLALLRWRAGTVAELRRLAANLSVEARTRLLLRVDRSAELAREEQRSYSERTAGDLSAEEYERAHEKHARMRRALDPARSAAVHRRRPVEWTRWNLALTLGPRDSWWHNGVQALRVGAVLAVVPVIQFVLLDLERFRWQSLTVNAPLGVAYACSPTYPDATESSRASASARCSRGRGCRSSSFRRPRVTVGLAGRARGRPLLRAARHRHGLAHLACAPRVLAAGRWQFAIGYAVPILGSVVLIVQQLIAGDVAEALTGEQQQRLTALVRSLPTAGQ